MSMGWKAEAQEMLAAFGDCLNSADASNFFRISRLPRFPIRKISAICQQASLVFASESCLLSITGPVVIVGDLHGHMCDLARILATCGLPPETKYLFLGDIVDRGEFSLECATLLLLMKVLYPREVFIIRGNHEFEEIYESGGFGREYATVYSDVSLLDEFEETFSQMPLAAVVNDRIFCVHGGIGPDDCEIDNIRGIRRPVRKFTGDIVDTLLWSDPTDATLTFRLSCRGTGFEYGELAFRQWLGRNGFDLLVRAHEVTESGVLYKFGNKLVTVFSASNYCGTSRNRAGVLMVGTGVAVKSETFDPLPYVYRIQVVFQTHGALPSINATMKSSSTVTLGKTPHMGIGKSQTLGMIPARGLSQTLGKPSVDSPGMLERRRIGRAPMGPKAKQAARPRSVMAPGRPTNI